MKGSAYWWIPTVLSFPLVFRGISARPLSHDEFYTLHAINEGLDQHYWEMPWIPYYWVMSQWTVGGLWVGDTWLRASSALVSIGTVALVALLGKRVSNRLTGFLAGVLMALVPSTQFFAHEARPYALGAFLFTAATLCLAHALHQKAWRPWILYGVVMLLGAAVFPIGLVVLPTHLLLVLAAQSRTVINRWLLSLTLVVPALAFHLLYLPSSSESKAWAPVPSALDIGPGLTWIGTGGTGGEIPSGGIAASIIVLGLLSRQGQLWMSGAFGGILLIWLVSVGPTSFWSGRSAIALIPIGVIAAASTLGRFQVRYSVPVVVLFALLTMESFSTLRQPRQIEPDMRQAVTIISENLDRSRVVVDRGSEYGIATAVRQYYGGKDLTFESTPSVPFWTVYQEPECIVLEAWDLGGDAYLKLCEPL